MAEAFAQNAKGTAMTDTNIPAIEHLNYNQLGQLATRVHERMTELRPQLIKDLEAQAETLGVEISEPADHRRKGKRRNSAAHHAG